jgi:hypothetical protein
MTIARMQFEGIGPRMYLPEGPLGPAGQFPFPSFAPGTVIGGDAGAEFVYILFPVVAALTLNQGDAIIVDNSYKGLRAATGAGAHPFGAFLGTAFFGGSKADQATQPSPGNVWSYTFATPGMYAMWVQRAGTSLLNLATVNAQTKPINTTAVAGQLNQPSAPLAGSMGIANVYSCETSWTFTGTTATGSAILTAVSQNRGLVIGQQLSGTGIATGAVITDIQGSTVTMSLVATAAGSVTITATNGVGLCTTTNGSTQLTNVNTIAGMYPNQTIAGTGIPGSTTIVSIIGNSAPYIINISAAATATANNIALTTSIYVEAFLIWPTVQVQN